MSTATLRPRPTTQAPTTQVTTATTMVVSRGTPQDARALAIVPRLTNFTADALKDPQTAARMLLEMQQELGDTIGVANSLPFIGGHWLRGISFPGVRGRPASGIGSPTITLERAEDAALFFVGMVVIAAPSDGSFASPRAGSATITAVNTQTGQLTCSGGNWNAAGNIPLLVTDDFLFAQGEYRLSVTISHGLPKTPRGYTVTTWQGASRPAALSLLSSSSSALVLDSVNAGSGDLLVF